MGVFISLLRGINLGPHNKISMQALSVMYKKLGFTGVKTFIQSGNVVFESGKINEGKIAALIHGKIENDLGFDVPVIVRTAAEIRKILKRNPFRGRDLEKLNVAFLSDAPGKVPAADFEKALAKGEKFRLSGREIYLVYANGVSKSKITNAFIEKKLGVIATTRNWNTVVKLSDQENM